MEISDNKIPVSGEQEQNVVRVIRPKNPFKPDLTDFCLAAAAFLIGYLFSDWVFFSWRGWGVAVFTTVYLAASVIYLIKKGAFIYGCPALFWLIITWLVGLSFALWNNNGISGVRPLFLFCSAVYFILCASGGTLLGKTSNFLLLDGINTVIFIPFRNFVNQYISFAAINKSTRKKDSIFSVLLGILFAVLMIAWLMPLLLNADSGGFSKIIDKLAGMFGSFEDMTGVMIHCVAAIPVSAYMYGLISGAAHKRNTQIILPEKAKEVVGALRILQPATVFITLGAVCGLYLVFILCQIPYFFSAFTGTRPEGWLVYSEYARQGFFELCAVASINLAVITAANVLCKKRRGDSAALKGFNIALTLITLLLIATALSKMALYIGAYGLSILRVLPSVFMVYMAILFSALIALQKWDFSIVRFALVTGSVILCVLCLINPDAIVVRYNAERYLGGTLSDFDTEILYRSGSAGILPALEVFNKTENESVKREIIDYFTSRNAYIGSAADTHMLSLEDMLAREAVSELVWWGMG